MFARSMLLLTVGLGLLATFSARADEAPDLPATAEIAVRIVLAGGSDLDEKAQSARTWARSFLHAHPKEALANLTERMQGAPNDWKSLVRDRVEDALEILAPVAHDTCVKLADLLNERAKTEARSLADDPENRDLLRETGFFAERMQIFLKAHAEAPAQPDKHGLDQPAPGSPAATELEARIKAALDSLSSEVFEQREAATRTLYTLGPPAEPYLRKALASPDAEVRERINRVLAGLHAPPPDLKASAWAKYRGLLRVVEVPDDVGTYGAYCDYGMWSGTEWKGHMDLPAGYWVYIAPKWYIWKEEWKAEPR